MAWAIGLLFAATMLAQTDDEWTTPPAWVEPIEPFSIGPRLHYVGTRELASYLFSSEAGHVLVDVPMEANADLVLDNVRRLGFEPKRIEIVLATHGHFDHTGGVAALLEATGAELLLSRHAAELVAAGGRGDFFLGDGSAYPPAASTRLIEDGEVIRLGETALTALFTPGHTRGCTSWTTTTEVAGEERSVVLGCSLSVLPGYQLVGEKPSYPGIGADFCRSVARLEALEPEVFLSNHGSFMRLDEKRAALATGRPEVFVDPTGYREYLAGARAAIERTLRAQDGVGCSSVSR